MHSLKQVARLITARSLATTRYVHSRHLATSNPKICIVGSGPAALYTAQYILKNSKTVNPSLLPSIDIYEKLPVPFGLVRYGVAPDHQDVKNVINSFTETIRQPSVNFFGNVNIGTDLRIEELIRAYNCVVLAYGSHGENYLGIPGEKQGVKNLVSAKDIVSWYNGVPDQSASNPVDLSRVRRAVIIGAGNVAVDIARLLVSPTEKLAQTDIDAQALEMIKSCRNSIENVSIVARRGLLNAAFTIKELRELTKLDPKSIACRIDLNHFNEINIDQIITKLSRPRRRLTEFLQKIAQSNSNGQDIKKTIEFKFLLKPVEILLDEKTNSVRGVKFRRCKYQNMNEVNKFDTEEDLNSIRLTETDEFVIEPADLVVRSIGYKNVSLDDVIPFDKKLGVVSNDKGRVIGLDGLYCTGWIKRGPRGVIVDTTTDAYETAHQLCHDLALKQVDSSRPGSSEILNVLARRNVRVVDKQGWARIDAEEVRRGQLVGKPREKINKVEEMLRVALQN